MLVINLYCKFAGYNHLVYYLPFHEVYTLYPVTMVGNAT
jgi:hypothetical protein